MNDPEHLDPGDILEMIVNQIVWAESSDDGQHVDGICDGLVQAYVALRGDLLEEDVGLVPFAEAEKIMRREYMYGARRSFGKPLDAAFEEGWMWPDSLTFEAGEHRTFPVAVARRVGYAMGYVDGRRTVALQRYALAQRASEAAAEAGA